MPICSYLVIPDAGASDAVRGRLGTISECDVVSAENRDLFLLVTETDTAEQDAALRTRIEALRGIRSLVLTFGEIDPDTDDPDPLASLQRRPKRDKS